MASLWRIYKTFFTSSLVRELEFRANFIASVIQNFVWIIFYVVIVLVIFGQTKSVAGWSREMVFLLMGTVFLMSSVHGMFFSSMFEIPDQVRRGTLDFVITRPVDSQFWVSLRRFSLNRIGSVVAACIMLGFGVSQGGFQPGPLSWVGYLAGLVISLSLFYALGLVLMTLAIYFVRIDNLWVVGETVLETARFPVDVYRIGIKDFLVYYLPLGFLASVPAQMLISGMDWLKLGAGAAWAAVALLASRWYWNWSLKSYTSASS